MKSKKRKRTTNSETTTTPVTTPETSVKTKEKTNKPASITAVVRRIVVRRPTVTAAQVADALVAEGWEATEVKRRMSTITTLRADAVAIVGIAREEGWSAPQGQ